MLQFIWQHLAVIGFMGLAVIFIASFLFRTAWGHWHTGKGRLYEGLTDKERQEIHHRHRD